MAQIISYPHFLSYIQRQAMPDFTVAVVKLQGLTELDALLGFTVINEVLETAVSRLTQGLRSIDVVVRLDRHQIAIMLPAIKNTQIAVLAGYKIKRLLAQPYSLSTQTLHLNPRIGMAAFVSSEETIEQMFTRAMTVIQRGQTEADGIGISDANNKHGVPVEYHAMAELARALETNTPQIYLQAQFEYVRNQISSAEALLRWEHPTLGVVNTDALIHLVEKSDLISKLTSWVIATSLRHCARARDAGIDMGIHVNLSAANLAEVDLVELIMNQLDVWKIPVEKLVIELTETAIIQEKGLAKKQMLALKQQGIKLSMDDFGSGYANLDRLLSLPLDEIKIDQVFTKLLSRNSMVEDIIAGVIDTAHKMGITVVAEGIEDKETFKKLRQMGCDLAQGYFISRPISIDNFIRHFAKS